MAMQSTARFSTCKPTWRQVYTATLFTLATFPGFTAAGQPAAPVQSQARQSAWVEQTLKGMTIEEKAGQMLQVRVYGDYPSFSSPDFLAVKDEIERYGIGSVDLGARMLGPNLVKGSPEQVAAVTNELQRISKVPLLVGADIERGLASRLSGVPDFPFPMAFGALADPALMEQFGAATAEEARAVGIEWAFAPDADINTNPLNPIINNRSLGDDPAQAGRLVAAYIRGAHRGGMMVALKHFPGEGDTATDPHTRVTVIAADRRHLETTELAPFRAALTEKPDSVMLAQASVPAIDPDPGAVAATSKKVVQGLLRGELGFQGIVITDALEMRGLMALYPGEQNPSGRIAVDAVKAGDDVLMLPRDLPAAFEALVSAVRSGDIPESRLDTSVRRILLAKASLGLSENRFVDPARAKAVFSDRAPYELAQLISDESITLVRDNGHALPIAADQTAAGAKPSSPGRKVVAVTFTDSARSRLGKTFEQEMTAKNPGIQFFHFYNDRIGGETDTASATAAIKDADAVVLAAFVTRLAPAQVSKGQTLVNAVGFAGVGAQSMGELLAVAPVKMAVVALGSPYLIDSFPQIETYLCTYSLTSTAEVSAAKALFGEIQNKATLPITLPGTARRGSSLPWPRASAVGDTGQ